MLRINRQTDYAVRVLLALAKKPPETRLSTAEIREEMLIPKSVSLRIVADLARGGFIKTFPGRDGGIKLAHPAENRLQNRPAGQSRRFSVSAGPR